MKGWSAMATLKARGNTHSLIYYYVNEDGKREQQWETYTTILEAQSRKEHIEFLDGRKMYTELLIEVKAYKSKRAKEKASREKNQSASTYIKSPTENNKKKTCREFFEKWLPIHARKQGMKGNSYSSYKTQINRHILPYFGNNTMSCMTTEAIDSFLDYLKTKPAHQQSRTARASEDTPKLASSTIKKCYTVISAALTSAHAWGYMDEIPKITATVEKGAKKRKAWTPNMVFENMSKIEDSVIRLAVHITFVSSLRAGEAAAISLSSINFYERSYMLKHEIQRIADEALEVISKDEIIKVFPKEIAHSKSCLVLTTPKNERSVRKSYLTAPLIDEIRQRMKEIEQNKEILGSEYQDYDLLICKPDGRPFDPKAFNKIFKSWQTEFGIPKDEQIEFQGLRKSGQMHKVRITNNNYQLVGESAGHTPAVLMSNYNEALDHEKKNMTRLVETSFYPQSESPVGNQASELISLIENNPELAAQLMQLMTPNAQA